MKNMLKHSKFHTFSLVLQGALGGMFALIGLVGNLGGGAVVVHRLGRRHIGVRPFETKRDRGQIEESQS
jgi:hypothetical protein